jgi:hypothetical protein
MSATEILIGWSLLSTTTALVVGACLARLDRPQLAVQRVSQDLAGRRR